MKAFVTGGTGFIGGHVVRKLRARGYEVTALARSGTGAALAALGARMVRGDIGDVESLRAGMQGSDLVLHLAGWYKIGSPHPEDGMKINVAGTRNVLGLAHTLGVPKIVYTSTVAIFGDTHGRRPDEHYQFAGPFLTEYDRTKWLADRQVAEPLIAQGAPIVIVMPGGVYGPGDASIVGELMTRFYKGQLVALPGPETGLTYAHVEDIAEGHVLAAEQGRAGERYILAGPALRLSKAVALWASVTGRRAPFLRIPAALLRPSAPLAGLLGRMVPLPSMFSAEAIRSLGATYYARADKARAQLGWRPRPLRAGFTETFAAIAQAAGRLGR
ncbi:MAG TPA: NAD-dependent epimerase/dehydratase family protein [Chloroflexia bacterium]|nr:NAD-dependent epimerase/dehydratase family protein [Chloroflexia bacterium]